MNALKKLWNWLVSLFAAKKPEYFYRLNEESAEVEQVPLSKSFDEEVAEQFAAVEELPLPEVPFTRKDLLAMKKKDLKSLALDCGILISRKDTKKSLVKKIENHFDL
jgi:hypothetical protein